MPYFRQSRYRSPRRSGGYLDIRRRMRSVDWSSFSLTKFEKKFYEERSSVRDRSRRDVEEFRSKNKVTVLGHNILRPIFRYSEAGFPGYISNVIKKLNWNSPTPVQSQSLPVVLNGRDLVGITLDNAGKIEAYLLPAMVHAKAQCSIKRGEGPIVIILVPNKEIVQKVEKIGEEFRSSAGLRLAYLSSAVSRSKQIEQLDRLPEIVVSTPNRIMDYIDSRHTNVKRCTLLVLDEADRMLELGYESSIRKIASEVRPDRQALIWSATWPREVKALAEDFLFDYIQINMGSTKLVINPNIRQYVEVVEEDERFKRLTNLLDSLTSGVLIFAESKRKADDLCDNLKNKSFAASVIQGDMTQKERDRVVDDIDSVRHVINYDYPPHIDDYVHRIDKAGKHDKGASYTYFTSRQTRMARELVDVLKEARQKVPDNLSRIAQGRADEIKRYKEQSWHRSMSRSRSRSRRSSSSGRSRSSLSHKSRSASRSRLHNRESSKSPCNGRGQSKRSTNLHRSSRNHRADSDHSSRSRSKSSRERRGLCGAKKRNGSVRSNSSRERSASSSSSCRSSRSVRSTASQHSPKPVCRSPSKVFNQNDLPANSTIDNKPNCDKKNNTSNDPSEDRRETSNRGDKVAIKRKHSHRSRSNSVDNLKCEDKEVHTSKKTKSGSRSRSTSRPRSDSESSDEESPKRGK